MFIGNHSVSTVDMYSFLLFGDCLNFYLCVAKLVTCFFENVGVNRIHHIFLLKND